MYSYASSYDGRRFLFIYLFIKYDNRYDSGNRTNKANGYYLFRAVAGKKRRIKLKAAK